MNPYESPVIPSLPYDGCNEIPAIGSLFQAVPWECPQGLVAGVLAHSPPARPAKTAMPG